MTSKEKESVKRLRLFKVSHLELIKNTGEHGNKLVKHILDKFEKISLGNKNLVQCLLSENISNLFSHLNSKVIIEIESLISETDFNIFFNHTLNLNLYYITRSELLYSSRDFEASNCFFKFLINFLEKITLTNYQLYSNAVQNLKKMICRNEEIIKKMKNSGPTFSVKHDICFEKSTHDCNILKSHLFDKFEICDNFYLCNYFTNCSFLFSSHAKICTPFQDLKALSLLNTDQFFISKKSLTFRKVDKLSKENIQFGHLYKTEIDKLKAPYTKSKINSKETTVSPLLLTIPPILKRPLDEGLTRFKRLCDEQVMLTYSFTIIFYHFFKNFRLKGQRHITGKLTI